MSSHPTPTTPLRPSQRANIALIAVGSGASLGALAGFSLPWQTWKIGGLTPLGDFALMAILGLLGHRLVLGNPTRNRLLAWLLATLLILGLREIFWRFLPVALAILQGMAMGILLAVLVGSAGYEIYRESRSCSRAVDRDAQQLVEFGFGLLILIWFLFGLVRAL
jgi:hypothetical protein